MKMYAKVNREVVLDRTLGMKVLAVSAGKKKITHELSKELSAAFGGDGYIPGEYLADKVYDIVQKGMTGSRIYDYKDCTFNDVEFYDWTRD